LCLSSTGNGFIHFSSEKYTELYRSFLLYQSKFPLKITRGIAKLQLGQLMEQEQSSRMKNVKIFHVPAKKNPIDSITPAVSVGDSGRDGYLCHPIVSGFGFFCPQSLPGTPVHRSIVKPNFAHAISD